MSFNIQENVLLKDFTTLKVGGWARFFMVAKNEEDLKQVFSFAKSRKLPIFILGGGSNLLILDKGFPGLVIKNEIKGLKFIDQADEKIILEIGAGEILDEVISLTANRNLFGLENLSGIPGTVGGAVVQNAGAYGSEIKDCLVSVAGLRFPNGKPFVLDNNDCHFGYRNSCFKKNKKYIITSVTLILNKKSQVNLKYLSLKEKLETVEKITTQTIRQAVLEIRKEKLPDWKNIYSAGSFFKNPVITKDKFDDLKKIYPNLPGFPESIGLIKVSLAWILDNICQLKGYREGNVGLYEKQPIVLVNFGQVRTSEIIKFSEKIKNIVKEKTGIKVEEEVEKC